MPNLPTNFTTVAKKNRYYQSDSISITCDDVRVETAEIRQHRYTFFIPTELFRFKANSVSVKFRLHPICTLRASI